METLFTHTLLLLVAAGVAVAIATRVGAPSILGYLIAGIALGPHGFGLIQVDEGLRFLAELGVVLLMFMVGLEFSLPTVWAARRMVLRAGLAQVLLTAGVITAGMVILGMPMSSAVLLGGAVAMSSTAITLKQLAEQGELTTRHGRLVTGVLLFQDLATLPFLILVSAWSQGVVAGPGEIVWQMVIDLGAVALAALVSRPLFRAVLGWVARTGTNELFLLAALILVLGTAFGAHALGLSDPLGAFLAGMVIGESDFRHRIEDDIRPFRDVLLGLFFITVGTQVAPAILLDSPWATLGWLVVFLLLKAVLALPAARLGGLARPDALRAAVILAHGGEFGLLLLSLALTHDLIPAAAGQPALFALAATMTFAPILIQHHDWIAIWLAGPPGRARPLEEEAQLDEQGTGMSRHTIVCGAGRLGRLVAMALDAAKLPCLVIELDYVRHREALKLGLRSVFGDATRPGSLRAAGIARASLVVVTFSNLKATERLAHFIHHHHPDVSLLVSTQDEQDAAHLAQLGITAVFPENLAAGLALSDQALLLAGLSQEEAATVITELRALLTPELRGHVGV